MLASLPVAHGFAGVGAAIVGVTRTADGFVHRAPNLGWRDVPLGDMLAQRLAVGPVSVANEADLGALCEHRRGSRAGASNLLFVSGEVGIGVGIILGGEPRRGAAGYAGEAGHTLVNPSGIRCACGATGCWETEAGEGALLRHAGRARRRRAAGGHRSDLARPHRGGDGRADVGAVDRRVVARARHRRPGQPVQPRAASSSAGCSSASSPPRRVDARRCRSPGVGGAGSDGGDRSDCHRDRRPLLGAAEHALTELIKHPNRPSTTRSRV